jgi:hypothetical protein
MTSPHFAGSLPFATAEEAFTWVGQTLGERAFRVPDGETGDQRNNWQPQMPWLIDNPTLQRLPDIPWGKWHFEQFAVKAGVEPVFAEPFEYTAWAIESYATFRKVRDAGGLPARAKLLVTMADGIDGVLGYVERPSFEAIYQAYAKQLEASVRDIAAAIPHEDLAIQWDTPFASSMWSGDDTLGFDDREFVLRELAAHADWVPATVDVGFHLCFGDGDLPEHMGEDRPEEDLPDDITGLVQLGNDLQRAMSRPLSFLHLPTLEHWTDPEHYAALRDLALEGTDVSLGVINLRRDHGPQAGVEHARRRVSSARAAGGPAFGISCACGMGRYTPKQTAVAAQLYDELQG